MSRPDLSGNTIAAKFKLEKRLGSGHFGDVYLGDHKVVGHRFALKVISVSPSTYDASALEAKLLNLSTHPHIVKVRSAEYWRDTKGNDFCLIEMEYVSGGNLQDLINREVSIGDLIYLMKNVLFALDHAHSMSVIHRDVKPANILVGSGGKLSDFGIAMVSATGASASSYIYNGNLAPECHYTPRVFSEASDIFAAGLTLLRGLNLVRNWPATRAAIPNWKEKMANGTFVKELGFHNRVPPRLRKIVNKACAAQPGQRYASAAAFRDALEGLKLVRNWRRTDPDTWTCMHDGMEEALIIAPGKTGFDFDYTRNGRRKKPHCGSGLSREQGLQLAYQTIASTSLK